MLVFVEGENAQQPVQCIVKVFTIQRINSVFDQSISKKLQNKEILHFYSVTHNQP